LSPAFYVPSEYNRYWPIIAPNVFGWKQSRTRSPKARKE
jgi:hypothetical protein